MSSSPNLQVPEHGLRPALKQRENSSRPPSVSFPSSPDPPSPPVENSGVKLLKAQTSTSFSPGYTNKVSFDTFENGATTAPSDAAMFSFTLQVRIHVVHGRVRLRVLTWHWHSSLMPPCRQLLRGITKAGIPGFTYVQRAQISQALRRLTGLWSPWSKTEMSLL